MPVALLNVLMEVLDMFAAALPKFMVVLPMFVAKMIRELQKGSGISCFQHSRLTCGSGPTDAG